MTRRLWFQLVGEDGNALTSAFCVDCADIAKVAQIRKAVKKTCPNTLANVDAVNLTIFMKGVALDPQAWLVGIDEKEKLIVQVHRIRAGITIDIPQVNWNISPIPCPRLLVEDDDQFIELPPSCVSGTGFGRPDLALILYRRPPLVKQWNEMKRCSIQTYARLWVVGPPGTGKSCAALAFAWSLDRSHWDVIWLHYSQRSKHFNCVWLEGNTKAVCVLKEEAIERDLAAILTGTSKARKTIVFLDGYVNSSAAGEAAYLRCLRWHQQDKIKHRLVCVCSMVSLGKEYRPELYNLIPANVDEQKEDVEMSEKGQTSELQHAVDRPVKSQMLFKLTSWRFEDYKEAILNDKFFESVMRNFPAYSKQDDPVKEANKRIQLVREKYFVAGGSARLMFDESTEGAIDAFDEVLETRNIEPYLHGFVGDSSSGAVHRLLAKYERPHGYDVRFVSEYVVRHFATVMGPRLVEKFATACNVNPSMNGFILGAWFFAQLSHNGLTWSEYVDSTLQCGEWERSSIVFFDPEKDPIGSSLDGSKWMAPVKWHQGGYDAVFVDKALQLVRFVQVTHAECQTFDETYFIDLLNRLVAGKLNQVAVVELCFVVPMARLEPFKLPVSTKEFKKIVVEVASSPSRATWSHPDQTFKACSANVTAIGVDL